MYIESIYFIFLKAGILTVIVYYIAKHSNKMKKNKIKTEKTCT